MKTGTVVKAILLASFVSLLGCGGAGEKIEGSGTKSTDKRELEAFSQIKMEGYGFLTIRSSKGGHRCTVIGDDNLVQYMDSSVDNGVLTLKMTRNMNPKNPPRWTVACDSLERLDLINAHQVKFLDFETERLMVSSKSKVKVTGSGNIKDLDITATGAAHYDIPDVKTESTTINASGACEFKVAVKTVQPGATLWAIAREQFGEGILYVAVYEANKEQIRDPNLIYPGQVFKIPEITE